MSQIRSQAKHSSESRNATIFHYVVLWFGMALFSSFFTCRSFDHQNQATKVQLIDRDDPMMLERFRTRTCAIHGNMLRFFHGEQMADDCGSMDVTFNGFQSKSEIETPKDSDFPQKKRILGDQRPAISGFPSGFRFFQDEPL